MSKQFQYINTQQIEDIVNGDLDFQKELIDIFLEQIPEFVSNMTTFLDEKNWELLAREAHTAKSSALTFGMEKAGTLLKQIQIHAEANELEILPELVTKALSHMGAAIPELEELKQSI